MLYVKNEEKVFVHRSRRIQSKVLYYADNVVLTMRSSAQIYLKRWQGAEEYALQSSLLLLFFVFFIFLNQINTARGLDVEMTVRDESDEENERTNEQWFVRRNFMPEVQFVTISSKRKDRLRTEPFLDILAVM